MDENEMLESHLTPTVAFVEAGTSLCLEALCDGDPSMVNLQYDVMFAL